MATVAFCSLHRLQLLHLLLMSVAASMGLASFASFEEEESCDVFVLKGIQGLAVKMKANFFNRYW